MIFVLLSIFSSVLVSIILKLSRRYEVPTNQLIAWNYPIALFLNIIFYKPDIGAINFHLENTSLYLVLGFLLPAIFLAIASSIRYTGIVRTEVAQRISIFIPLIAAFLIFNETPTARSILGIAIALLAIFFSIRWGSDKNHHSNNKTWIFPLIIFLGMGIIDILFKQVAQQTEVPYTSSVFFIFLTALIISFVFISIRIYKGIEKASLSAFFWGIGLGIFNFGNILFYLKAHNAIPENPSIVFSAMNVGVIALGAIVGLFMFKERLTTLNKIGILLAIVAILIIAGNESI